MVTKIRSLAHASPVEEEEAKVGSKKKSDSNVEIDTRTKKPKVSTGNEARSKNYKGNMNAKSALDIAAAKFNEFCKAIREHLSVDEMRKILEANNQDASSSNDAVVPRCQDMMFYGPLENCPLCKGNLVFTGRDYSCKSTHSGWSTCNYSTKELPRKEKAFKFPNGISNTTITVVNNLYPPSPELSIQHHWRIEIETNGGKVSAAVLGVTCLVVSPADCEDGGSSKMAKAMQRNIPVVREAWLKDSIDR